MKYIADGNRVWDTSAGEGNYRLVFCAVSPESAQLYLESLLNPKPPKPLTAKLVLIGNGLYARTKARRK